MLEILNWVSGKKIKEYIPIPDTNFKLPVTIIHGQKQGNTVLITSGIHGSEYVGIAASIDLACEINPCDVTGTIIFIHPVNTTGFFARTNLTPEDGKNLNRVYPGKPDGTPAEKLAWFISSQLYPNIDYYIDMHGGAHSEQLYPHVYYCGATADDVAEKARAMALASGQEFLVKLTSTNFNTTCSYAGSINIPAILIECGGQGIWMPKQVQTFKSSVSSVLTYLGTYNGKIINNVLKQYEVVDIQSPVSNFYGCWYPEKQPGDTFNSGELLGCIKDFFGNELQRIVAEFSGVLLYQTCSLCISKNEETVVYGKIH